MKHLSFAFMAQTKAANAAPVIDGKVDETFVSYLRKAFEKPINNAELRFKQSSNGRLIANLRITYSTGAFQRLAGGVDVDLIDALISAMRNETAIIKEYKAAEHYVETPDEGENLVLDLFSQLLHSPMKRMITTDFISEEGTHYRRVFFFPTSSHKRSIKFCLRATEEVNSMIENVCQEKSQDKTNIEDELDNIDDDSSTDSDNPDLN